MIQTDSITHVEETHLNADRGYMLDEPLITPIEDTIFEGTEDKDMPGEIFRFSQGEYGRCISKVYVDTADGIKAIGWVFQKRERYEDCDETFMRETWITLLRRREIVETREYAELAS